MIAEVLSPEIPDEYRDVEQEVSALEVRVQALQITSEPDHEAACALERRLAEQDSNIVARLAPAKAAAHHTHKELCDLETLLRSPIGKARPILKAKIGEWRAAQRREAERLAQAAREAARRQAEEEALLRAQSLHDRGEAARADAVLSTFTAPAVVVSAPKASSHGVRSIQTWSATVEDKLALLAWVAERPEERHVYLDPNLSNLSAQAKMFKAGLAIPGVKPVSRWS